VTYPLLRQGDAIPAVGVVQRLLNRTGAELISDGIFGPRTKDAVVAFQRPRGLFADGVIGRSTWPRLAASARRLAILDCIDVFDPSLLAMEANDIRRAGGDPLLIGGMSNGGEQAVMDITRAASAGSIFLLRFHGHGAPGLAGVSDGQGGIAGEHFSSIHNENFERLRSVMRRLRPIFAPYGCIQFMHCSTGRGRNGRQLLSAIANELGVPASAGVTDQLGGGPTTFRFEGPTHTAISGGGTLRGWCSRLPEFPPMTVR
jgi:hypothetical protein